MSAHTKEEILRILSAVKDPEIPVVSIAEMGMLRDVQLTGHGYEVTLMPTYSGCPAMGIIEQDIRMTLEASGVFPVIVKTVLQPAWNTDMMGDDARAKLKAWGIAPPLHSSCHCGVFAENTIHCPRCQSANTTVVSRFGSTACKALYRCNDCKEPFEYFKTLA